MVEILDLQHYYEKLSRNEIVTADEVGKLLKMVAHLQQTAAYLAECHAATAETLPASASKSSRGRHASICDIAAKALSGDASGIRFPQRPEAAIARCEESARRLNESIRAHDAKRGIKKA